MSNLVGSAWEWLKKNFFMLITKPASGPLGSVVVIVGSVLIGILFSAFTSDIQSSPPAIWMSDILAKLPISASNDWTIPAKIFWITFVVIVAVVCSREYYNYHKNKENYKKSLDISDELDRNISKVQDIARTMPPKDYLGNYAHEFKRVSFESEASYQAALMVLMDYAYTPDSYQSEGINVEELREHVNENIRLILDAILNLASNFDKPHSWEGIKYSANIMWLKAPDEFSDRQSREAIWEAANQLSDCENADMFFSAIDQLLLMDVNLTTNNDNVGMPDADDVGAICLGYKHGERGEGYNLPGAPKTLMDGGYSHVLDTTKISEELKQYGDKARNKVAEFYENDDRGRSILSMPISGFDLLTGDKHEAMIAVLSVYRNTTGIMQNDRRALMFYYQMVPFLKLLFRLCWVRQQLDDLGGCTVRAYTRLSICAQASCSEE